MDICIHLCGSDRLFRIIFSLFQNLTNILNVRADIIRFHEVPVDTIMDQLPMPPVVRGHDRLPAKHGFEDVQRQPFPIAAGDCHISRFEIALQLRGISQESNVVLKAQRARCFRQALFFRPVSGDQQTGFRVGLKNLLQGEDGRFLVLVRQQFANCNQNMAVQAQLRFYPLLFICVHEPDRYLDYIQSTGTEYINTGVRGRSDTKAEIEMEWCEVGEDWSFLDARGSISHDTDPNSRFFMWHTSLAKFAYGYVSYARQDHARAAANTRYHVVTELAMGRQTLTVNDQLIASGSDSRVVDAGCNLYVFVANIGDSTPSYFSKARLYRLKLWQKATDETDYVLLRDFRPAIARRPDGVYVLPLTSLKD